MAGKKDSFWIPYADLMTVLMLIFLFIAMVYMALMQKQKKMRDQLFRDFKETKLAIYKDLSAEFKDDMKNWDLELDHDLSIKFTNPEVLFPSKSSIVPDRFKRILIDFFPRYLNVIMIKEYREKISEIRIEGHTDAIPVGNTNDPYIDNIELSQDRSRSVLHLLRGLHCYRSLKAVEEKQLQYWLTANGLSYGRTLDSNKRLTRNSGLPANNEYSRRVEFRIVTASDKIVDEATKQIEPE